jgi:hypothetical protein
LKMSRILLALGLAVAIAAPTAAAAGMMDDMMAKMKDAHAPYAEKMAAMMAMADTEDRDFWLKCVFHKTDACEAAMDEMIGK